MEPMTPEQLRLEQDQVEKAKAASLHLQMARLQDWHTEGCIISKTMHQLPGVSNSKAHSHRQGRIADQLPALD